MDIDGDGALDILSGSYSRMDQDMAGLFWVLRGREKGVFSTPAALEGTDGKPLTIGPVNAATDTRICTRPTAADMDGDGHLDLVVGNFAGGFFIFRGRGRGAFSPKARRIVLGDRTPMKVRYHSDPHVVDWDADGDLDIVSGSESGGVFLFENSGTAKRPHFLPARTLVPRPPGNGNENIVIGASNITAPRTSTRVFVSDVDGDGVHDLLVGDMGAVYEAASGVSEAEAREGWEAIRREMKKPGALEDADDYERFETRRKALVEESLTGWVWLFRGKAKS